MMFVNKAWAPTLIGLTGLAILPLPAQGAEPQAVADALRDALQNYGVELRIGEASAEQDDIVLSDVTLVRSDPAGSAPGTPEPLDLGTLRLEGVSGSGGESGWQVNQLDIPADDFAAGRGVLDFGGASFSDLHIPGPETTDYIESNIYYGSLEISPMAYMLGDRPIVETGPISLTNSDYSDRSNITSEFQVESFLVDLQSIPDIVVQQVARQIGYSDVTGSMHGSSSWNAESGSVEVSDLALTLDDAASLDMDFQFEGMTAQLLQRIEQAPDAAAAGTGDVQQDMAMRLLDELKIGDFQISLTDNSLVNRLIDYFAAQQGMQPEMIRASMMAFAPGIAGQFGDPQFVQQSTQALQSFFNDPGTLTIAGTPEQPVSLATYISTLEQMPQTTANLLGLSISATENGSSDRDTSGDGSGGASSPTP